MKKSKWQPKRGKVNWTIFYRSIRINKGYNSKNDADIVTSYGKRMMWFANRVYISCH